jgi:type I restriction enzyme M protein
MIDASKGFVKDGNKNRLRSQDIHKIVDAFTKQAQIDKYSRMVPLAEIEKNDFNLNIPRYIDASEPEDLQDIEAHLKGGIPVRDVDALEDFWQVVPAVRHDIFAPGERPGYLTPMVEAAEVKPAILNHAEFAAYADTVTEVFDAWRAAHIDRLRGIDIGDKPKDLIHVISEDLLDRFKPVPLIDGYDVYQHLMTYWSEVMQDDVYVLVQDGWKAGRVIRELVKNAEGKFTETPDITLGRRKLKAELIPPALIVARFFASEKAALEALEAKAEEAARAIEELDEEHGGEDGLLADAKTEKGKLTAKSVKDRIKDIRHDRDAAEEMAILKQALGLIEAEAAAARAVKEAQAALDEATVRHYAKLTGDQLKALIVEDKWLARLQGDVAAEVDRVSQALAGRVKLLTERYAAPLLVLEDRAQALGAKVAEHLKRMGFAA